MGSSVKVIWYGSPEARNILAPESVPADQVACADDLRRSMGVVLVIELQGRNALATFCQGVSDFCGQAKADQTAAAIIVCSFEAREAVARRLPLLATPPRVVAFLRLPFSRQDLATTAELLPRLTVGELRELLRWRCGLQDEWRRTSHQFAGAIRDWPAQALHARLIVSQWRDSVSRFARDQLPALERLDEALATTPDRIRAATQELEDGLCIRPYVVTNSARSQELPEAPCKRPPPGFSAIAIADDCGYELATIRVLKRLGYEVAEPARSLQEAEALLRFFRPHVVLADLFFPSREAGEAVMRQALATESVRLVIGTSRARAESDELPVGVEDCCGGLDFQDADRIHRIIWRRALAEGGQAHA
jgi:hypothetical protein